MHGLDMGVEPRLYGALNGSRDLIAPPCTGCRVAFAQDAGATQSTAEEGR